MSKTKSSSRSVGHDELLKTLKYHPRLGVFTWLVNRKQKKAGDIAGCVHPQGYIVITLGSRQYQAHRLAWFYMKGWWPDPEVDHRDGVRNNNRWENLREANRSQNTCNTALSSKNKVGLKGVRKKKWGRYTACIWLKGKSVHLGSFDTPQEAHAAYMAEARKHFGEFARAS